MIRLSKNWLVPLFRKFHNSLAPAAQPGRHAGNPLLRNAFCGSGGLQGADKPSAGLSMAGEKAAVPVFASRQTSMDAKAHTATAANPFLLAIYGPKGHAPEARQTRPIFWILRNTIVNFPTAKVKGRAVFSYINYMQDVPAFCPFCINILINPRNMQK